MNRLGDKPLVGVVGIGKMGSKILELLRESQDFEARSFDTGDKPEWELNECEIVIIAVKPQSFESLSQEIQAVSFENKLVVSIMAGVSIDKIVELLGAKKVVRSMPNLALQVGQSLSAWYGNSEVKDEDAAVIEKLLALFGCTVNLEQEADIDKVTAISGSGPAYFCKMVEALANTAEEEFGFDSDTARLLASQTLIGTSELLKTSLNASDLKAAVCSRGGTTEAAIKKLEELNFDHTVVEAVLAAEKRAKELNN